MNLLDRLWAARHAYYGTVMDSGIRYLILAAFFYLAVHIIFARRLANRHISRKKVPLVQMSWELLFSIRSVLIYGVVGVLIYFFARMGYSQVYTPIDRYGWPYFFLSIVIAILMHDTYFYWTHRWMHHPKIFRWVHRTHHLSTNVSPWASYAFSVPEAFVQAGIGAVIIFTLPIHPLAFWIFMIWQVGFSVFGHCGYELYPTWFMRSWLGKVFNTVTHHSQHHEVNRANFSLYFNFWDRLMGTNHARYVERFSEAVGETEAARDSGRVVSRPARRKRGSGRSVRQHQPVRTPASHVLQGR